MEHIFHQNGHSDNDGDASLDRYRQGIYAQINEILNACYEQQDARIGAIAGPVRDYIQMQLYDEQGQERIPRLRHLEKLTKSAYAEFLQYQQEKVQKKNKFYRVTSPDAQSTFIFEEKSPAHFYLNVTFWGVANEYGDHTGILEPDFLEIVKEKILSEPNEPKRMYEVYESQYEGKVGGIPATFSRHWRCHNNGEEAWYDFHFASVQKADAFRELLQSLDHRGEDPALLQKAIQNDSEGWLMDRGWYPPHCITVGQYKDGTKITKAYKQAYDQVYREAQEFLHKPDTTFDAFSERYPFYKQNAMSITRMEEEEAKHPPNILQKIWRYFEKLDLR